MDAFGAGARSQSEVTKLLGTPGVASSKGDIRNANCNAVFVEVRRRADTMYPSGMGEPYMSGLSPSNFNALQAIINAAHDTTGGKQRIEVHAWIVTFATATGSSVSPVYYQHNNPNDPDNYWITLDDAGNETDDKAFDPGHPKAAQYIHDVCMDLVNNFDIDGLHFDYIRFTGINQGYNPTSISRFRQQFPNKPAQIPYTDDDFEQWRRDQVTAVVRNVYASVQQSKPWVKVSGAFVGGAPGPTASTRNAFKNTRPYYQYYSDWDSWLQEGIIDMAVPMMYFDQAGSYAADYTRWMNFGKDRKASRQMVIGPGVYLNSLSNAISQIKQTRNPSPSGNYADGFAGYSYRVPYAGGTWAGFAPSLVSQVTPSPTDIPTMPWKTAPTKGHIRGHIFDGSTGAPVDGASVTVTGPVTRTQKSDGTGHYAFIDLPPGTYTVSVAKPYFASASAQQAVAAGTMAVRNFTLSPSGCTYATISGVTAQGISTQFATILWTTDLPSDSRVEYGTTASYGSMTLLDPALVTNHSVVLSGLSANTLYYYRVISTPGGGCSSVSSGSTFTTTGVAVPDVVIESRKSNGTLTPSPSYTEAGSWGDSTAKSSAQGLSGSGSRYATNFTGATATFVPSLPYSGPYEVYVTWGASSNGASTNFKVISGGSVVYNHNWDQNNAQPYENQWQYVGEYTFNAGQSASNASVKIDGNASSKGTTGGTPRLMSDAVKFVFKGSAGDVEPPSRPAGLQVQSVTTSEVHLSWTASTDNIAVTGYRIYKDNQPVATVSEPEYTDVGLSANTSFSYGVSAYDAGGNESAISVPATAVTLSEAPTPETITCNKNAGDWYTTSDFVFSTQGGFGPGRVAKYRVAWDKSPTHTWGGSGESDWTQLGLLKYASSEGSWYFHAQSYNSAGVPNGSYDFGPYNFDATAPTIPAVTDDGATTTSVSSLHASWSATDPGSGVAEYEYRLLEQGGPVIRDWTSAGSATEVTVTFLSLAPGKTYVFEVRATNAAGLTSGVGTSDGITVVAGQSVARIGQLKQLEDDTVIQLSSAKPVCAVFGSELYICESDRSAGISVVGNGFSPGDLVSVSATLTTTASGERQLKDAILTPAGSGSPLKALSVSVASLGGVWSGVYTPPVGGAPGLQNTGLLVQVTGRVTFAGADFFYLDDGSSISDGSGYIGVRVYCPIDAVPAVGTTVSVTGISSSWKSGAQVWPMIKEVSGGISTP